MITAQKQWFYGIEGEQRGPVDPTQLNQLIASGSVNGTTLVWTDGMSGWRPLNETELQGAFLEERGLAIDQSTHAVGRSVHDMENEAVAKAYVQTKYKRLTKKHTIGHVLEAYYVYKYVQESCPSAAFAKKRESQFLKKVIENMKKSLDRAKKYGVNIDLITAYERYKSLLPSMQHSKDLPAIRFITADQETRENRIETAKNVVYGLMFGGMLIFKALYANK